MYTCDQLLCSCVTHFLHPSKSAKNSLCALRYFPSHAETPLAKYQSLLNAGQTYTVKAIAEKVKPTVVVPQPNHKVEWIEWEIGSERLSLKGLNITENPSQPIQDQDDVHKAV